eukprot:scaffold8049_cov286-Pinguiococcus_pyrenoidosus.AAC.2
MEALRLKNRAELQRALVRARKKCTCVEVLYPHNPLPAAFLRRPIDHAIVIQKGGLQGQKATAKTATLRERLEFWQQNCQCSKVFWCLASSPTMMILRGRVMKLEMRSCR